MADINKLKDICISSGTLRAEDLLPRFMGILKDYAPEKFNEFIKGYPELDGWEDFLEADWRIISDDTKMNASDELFGLLNDIAPEGTMFSSTEGDGADFGFWSMSNESKKTEGRGEYISRTPQDDVWGKKRLMDVVNAVGVPAKTSKIVISASKGDGPTATLSRLDNHQFSTDAIFDGHPDVRFSVVYSDARGRFYVHRYTKAPEGSKWAWDRDWSRNGMCATYDEKEVVQFIKDNWDVATPDGASNESKKSEKGNKDIFTLDLTRIDSDGDEEGLDDMQAAQTFYDEDDAIKAAKELADSYKDDDDVVQVTVMAGEQEKPNGDIVGEPFDIFTASSSDSATTAKYREKAGYTKTDGLDYYAKGGKSEAKKKYYGYGKDDAIDKEDNDFMWQVAYDWFVDKLPGKLARYADKAVTDVIDKDSRAYEEIVTMDDYYDYLETYGPAVIEEITGDLAESKKTESSGADLASIYGDGDVSTHENSADGFYVNEHDPMGFAVLNNDTATMKKLFSGKAVAPEKPWTYAGWHEDIDAPENKDGSYPYVYDWEREYDLNFVNDWKRIVGDKDNEKALELLLKYAPDFIPSAMDFWNAFHAGYSKGLLRKLFDNIFAVVDKDDPYNNYLGYGDYTYDEVAKFLEGKGESKNEDLNTAKDIVSSIAPIAILVRQASQPGFKGVKNSDDHIIVGFMRHDNTRFIIDWDADKKQGTATRQVPVDDKDALYGYKWVTPKSNANVTFTTREELKDFVEGSWDNTSSESKKKESISGKLLLDPEKFEKAIRDVIDNEKEDILKSVDDDEREYYEMAFETLGESDYDYAGELCKRLQDDMLKYVSGNDYRIMGNFNNIESDWNHDHEDGIKFQDLRKKLLDGVKDADTDEFSTWAIDWFFDTFGTYNMCYKYHDMVSELAYSYQQENERNGDKDESKKSESLTLKQKELKDMARYGEAEDITTISDAEAKELKKKGIETVGVSRGTYGMNGALLRDREGNKYVITARSSNLFYFV